jgi:hypothetical protein
MSGFSLLEIEVAFVLLGITLAGLGPLVVVHLKHTAKMEQQFNTSTTYYLAPASDAWALTSSDHAWARKLGASAALRTEALNPNLVSTFELHVNFQRSEDPASGVFEGHSYLDDCGWIFGDRGNGYTYGWDGDATAHTRNRNHPSSTDERYDTLCHMQMYGAYAWEIAVPHGTYRVRVVAGDAEYTDSIYKTLVEGVLAVDGIPSATSKWITGYATVHVTDGRLTVSNAPGSSNNKICFIDIAPAAPNNEVRVLSLEKSPISEEVTVHVSVQAVP